MNARFFLDTNVFIYKFDDREREKTRRAAQLVDDAILTSRGVVSYQVVQEFFSTAFTRFAKPLERSDAEEYFSTVFKPLLAIHSSPLLFWEALRIHAEHRFSWYDALIVAAAQQADCSVLYTEDMQHGRRIGDLRIENPFR